MARQGAAKCRDFGLCVGIDWHFVAQAWLGQSRLGRAVIYSGLVRRVGLVRRAGLRCVALVVCFSAVLHPRVYALHARPGGERGDRREKQCAAAVT